MLPDTAYTSVLSDYLTKHQLAAQLGRSIRTIDRMALNGEGPPRTKIGSTTLYRREAVLGQFPTQRLEQWWDAHFISPDYGFGKSSASVHLHVRTQDGRLKTIGEFVAPHLPAYEFAREVANRFRPTAGPRTAPTNCAVYLDLANFKNIGDGHTIADQINEILSPCDLGAWNASNDRIGGWQLMYQLLQKGEWQITDTCPGHSAL